MNELYGYERCGDDRQGYLFAGPTTSGLAPTPNDDPDKRRPGETTLDYRIRRQYRDVAATAALFPIREPRGRRA